MERVVGHIDVPWWARAIMLLVPEPWGLKLWLALSRKVPLSAWQTTLTEDD